MSVPRSAFILLFGLFALALLPRLYLLDAQSLWLDEGNTWQAIGYGWGALLRDLTSPFSAYPLYHLLLKGWVVIAGDSEWALRFPSALAGAGAAGATYLAAKEIGDWRVEIRADAPIANRQSPIANHQSLYPLAAALLLAASPFAIWYAQEAKVYSLLLLVAALLLWCLLRARRLMTLSAWLLFAAVALTSVFVHRLAVLLLVAALAAMVDLRFWVLDWRGFIQHPKAKLLHPQFALGILVAVGCAAVVWAMQRGLGSEGAATGAAIPADPATALWLTFVRFSVDRGPGDAPWWWLLPWGLLALWGIVSLARTKNRIGSNTLVRPPRFSTPNSQVLLCFLFVPLALFLIQLAYTRFYEPRYLILIYPAWVLLLALPLAAGGRRQEEGGKTLQRSWLLPAAYSLLFTSAIAISIAVLFQPRLGLFSGAPVKEQYREAISELARRVQPDDLVVIHPGYLRPLYDYYMQRLSADPPPTPVSFADFWYGGANQSKYGQREWDIERQQKFAGYLRSFLLIAPHHARTVDVPKNGDEYGLVGLYFQYSREQKKWPCGIWRPNGVHLLCQESPEAYYTGVLPQPSTPMQATFGDSVHLLGYTLKATTPGGPGVYRAGGNLPISLFFDVTRQPTADYNMFVHLCQDCTTTPVASNDEPPLAGYLPTSTWLPGHPARDDRSITLPRDLPLGRYNLVLGFYRPGDPSPAARLPATGAGVFGGNSILLGTVEIVASG